MFLRVSDYYFWTSTLLKTSITAQCSEKWKSGLKKVPHKDRGTKMVYIFFIL